MSTEEPTKRILVVWPSGRETEHRVEAHAWMHPGDTVELWEGLGSGGILRRVEMEITEVNGHIITVKRPFIPFDTEIEMGDNWGSRPW